MENSRVFSVSRNDLAWFWLAARTNDVVFCDGLKEEVSCRRQQEVNSTTTH